MEKTTTLLLTLENENKIDNETMLIDLMKMRAELDDEINERLKNAKSINDYLKVA